jgi:hypothetical protein
MNTDDIDVSVPTGGLVCGPWINDLTQLMKPEDAAQVRTRLPFWSRSGPGYLTFAVPNGIVAGFILAICKDVCTGIVVGLLLAIGIAVIPIIGAKLGLFDEQALRAARRAILKARGVSI